MFHHVLPRCLTFPVFLCASPCRLSRERQAVGFASQLTVALVSRGPILQGLTPYARRTFLPLLEVRCRQHNHGCCCCCRQHYHGCCCCCPLSPCCCAGYLRRCRCCCATAQDGPPSHLLHPSPRSVASCCTSPTAAWRRCSLERWCWQTASGCPLMSACGARRPAPRAGWGTRGCLSTQASHTHRGGQAGWLASRRGRSARTCRFQGATYSSTSLSVGQASTADGFLLVDECLRSAGGPPNVFAAGDVASCAAHPRPKAGVFAVRAVRGRLGCVRAGGGHRQAGTKQAGRHKQITRRMGCEGAAGGGSMPDPPLPCRPYPHPQGAPLAENLRRALAGEALQRWKPQATFLSLISAGDKYVVATKGWLGERRSRLWTLPLLPRSPLPPTPAPPPPCCPPMSMPLPARLSGQKERKNTPLGVD